MLTKIFIKFSKQLPCLFLSLSIALTGCTTTGVEYGVKSWLKKYDLMDTSIQDVAAVHVAVLSVASFQKYREAVQPQFQLTAQEALLQVLPSTVSTEQRIVDSLNLQLKGKARMSMLGIDTEAEKNTGNANEQNSDSDKKESTESKTEESKSQSKTIERTAASLPIAASATSLNQNPLLKYWTAVALYQEVQLLNRYVEDAAIRRNCNTFVVRLQITLLPWARNQPYDAYADISFFDDPVTTKNIQVLPLLVTDDIEAALVSRTNDRVRALAFALSAAVENVDLTSNIDKVYEKLESISGRDYNSAFTVARISENTLRARFGALNQGSKRYSMIPQTHNVTFLLIVPKKIEGDVKLVCRTTILDTKTGRGLMDHSKDTIEKNIDNISKKHKIKLDEKQRMALQKFIEDNNYADFKALSEEIPIESIDNISKKNDKKLDEEQRTALHKYIEDNNYADFKALCEKITKESNKNKEKFQNWQFLWTDLAQERDMSRYQTATLELPIIPKPDFPDEKQTIMLIDDAKINISATLTGFKGLNAKKLQVNLKTYLRSVDMDGKVLTTCDNPDKDRKFPPECENIFAADSIKSGTMDGQFIVTFPSLAAINRAPVKNAVEITVVSLEGTTPEKTYKANYSVKKADRSFEIAIRERVINSNEKGEGKLAINFTKTPKNGVTLNLSGAAFDISKVTADPVDSLSAEEKKKGILKLNKAALVTIELFNLSPESYVTVYGADETGESSAPITLRVASLSGSGKGGKE